MADPVLKQAFRAGMRFSQGGELLLASLGGGTNKAKMSAGPPLCSFFPFNCEKVH
jgi:hypothetical protein